MGNPKHTRQIKLGCAIGYTDRKERNMIKLYVNDEWFMAFDNQNQLDNWYQAQDIEYLVSNEFRIEYVTEE